MGRRASQWLLIGTLVLGSCGDPGDARAGAAGEATGESGTTVAESLDEGIGARLCDLLDPDEVSRYDPTAEGAGVYDGFLAPLADVCRYDGAFTMQLDYGPLMGEPADIDTYRSTVPGTASEAIVVAGFPGFVDYTETDAELGTDAFVNQVVVQVGDWVLLLEPDDQIDPFGPESATLQELAGLAAGRV